MSLRDMVRREEGDLDKDEEGDYYSDSDIYSPDADEEDDIATIGVTEKKKSAAVLSAEEAL